MPTSRKVWTRAEVEAIAGSGVVDLDHVELIEGELIEKTPKNQPHGVCLALLQEWIRVVFGALRAITEHPIDVSPEDTPTSLPEPDLAVLTRTVVNFPKHPRPEDILLLIEISDSSLAFDLRIKAGLYARAGIQDYWVLDIDSRHLIVHRKPKRGRYSSTVSYDADERVAPLAAPEAELLVADVLTPIE